MTTINQRKIISDIHIFEDKKDFDKFLKGKKPVTQKRYKAYRIKSKELRAEGYNFRYDKNTRSYVYTKRGIQPKELKRKEFKLSVNEHFVHGYFFRCEYAGNEFEHTYHYASKKDAKDSIVLHRHTNLFPEHILIKYEYMGSKVVKD